MAKRDFYESSMKKLLAMGESVSSDQVKDFNALLEDIDSYYNEKDAAFQRDLLKFAEEWNKKAGVQYQNDLQRFYLNQRINSMIGNSHNVCKDAEGIHRRRLDAIPLGRPHILYDAIGSKFIIAIIR